VPASCEACGKCDLLPANETVISLLDRFPSLIAHDAMTGRRRTDLASARWIAGQVGEADPLFFIEQIEAVCRGLNEPE